MNTFAVTYTYDPATADDRDRIRPQHVEFLRAQFDAGHLVMSGAYGSDESPGALLIFNAETKAELLAMLDNDPYHVGGLIAQRSVVHWPPYFGADRIADTAKAR